MTQPDEVARARTWHHRLIDPEAAEGAEYFQITGDERADELRSRLAEMFRARPALDRVTLRLGSAHVIGVATRSRVLADPGTAAEPLPLGGSDHASLPGLSQQYLVIRFACTTPGCGSADLRSFYDARDIPRCGIASHGELAVQR
ncbi:hypothetical protein [Streptomyces sp. NPDC057695]|uniref:hypothetical protein n=1 Tax=Streptomyces sp. NPDC057695 TaxID=3346217 RepID=UPI003695FCB8